MKSEKRNNQKSSWMLVMLLALSACGCDQTADFSKVPLGNSSKNSKTIKVVNVQRQNASEEMNLPISLEGFENTQLVSRIEGYVKEVKVDIGDTVKPGDVLIELDAPELEAENNRRKSLLVQAEKQLQAAEAKMNQAQSQSEEQEAMQKLRQSELNRTEKLVSKGSLSSDRLDEAKFGLASAKASLARVEADVIAAEADIESAKAAVGVARAELEKAVSMAGFRKIVAPFEGVITMRNADSGAYVVPSSNSDDALLRIERVSKLRGVMYIGTGGVSTKTKIKLHNIAGLPNVKIDNDADGKPLTISRMSNVFDPQTRLMRIESEINPPVDKKTKQPLLKPGDYATASLQLSEGGTVMTVPKSAIGKDGEQAFVVVLTKDRVCQRVKVSATDFKDGMIAVQPAGAISLEGVRVIDGSPGDYKDGQEIEEDMKIAN